MFFVSFYAPQNLYMTFWEAVIYTPCSKLDGLKTIP